ncbi:hypothetical protein HBI56_081240 [Parastagonospora nodorum]|nr:hypothetical protein HBH51_064830 [Parastagonospora nodorum]KAH3999077.1 hypothetical protein HBI10_121330 [Parastagonospora nodorum]KAH4024982.1 hypothetical protein HBI13_075860 [Parastagonospora nodorum]KAH5541017.1 hypothetical protein HBI27_096380 [Parastagonospora nodorum]KAH6523238.1 hypothetical protein HBI56_081240 [Parastagonospora nodorum]
MDKFHNSFQTTIPFKQPLLSSSSHTLTWCELDCRFYLLFVTRNIPRTTTGNMKSFAFLCLISVALAAPSPLSWRINAAAPAAPAAPKVNCTEVQAKLEKGIKANLDIQAQELQGVHALQLQGGLAEFETTQQSVLSIQQKGITIRAENQKLAAEIKSPAADGLAIVAGAQTKEMMQVMSLKGTAADEATLKLLVQEVQDGTKQNQKNLAAATNQTCTK